MLNATILYNLLKPISNYEIIIGGTTLPINFYKGVVVITYLDSMNLSNSYKDFQNPINVNGEFYINETTITRNNYQVDVYKINKFNITEIESHKEALKIKEYLKSYQAMEYMKKHNAEIIPCYDNIKFSHETNGKGDIVDRAFFTMSIITLETIKEKINAIEKINFKLGGVNEKRNTVR